MRLKGFGTKGLGSPRVALVTSWWLKDELCLGSTGVAGKGSVGHLMSAPGEMKGKDRKWQLSPLLAFDVDG